MQGLKPLPFFYAIFVLIAAFWIFCHYPLLKHDPLLYRDDQALIQGVAESPDLITYGKNVLDGKLLDIQPVRDLSFYINLKLLRTFGYGGFHLLNLFIGLALLLALRALLLELKFEDQAVLTVILLVALHPLLNTAMAWVSNRKHLLSMFFVLLYLRDFLKHDRVRVRGMGYFFLSLLSQPITIFFPFIIIGYKKFQKKKNPDIVDAISCLASVAFFVLNIQLYETLNAADTVGMRSSVSVPFGVSILNLARSAVQVLLPTTFAVMYDPGNTLSLIGIPLSVLVLYGLIKWRPEQRDMYLLLFLAIGTLFPVLKWGPRDAYLIFSLMATAAIIVSVTSLKWKRQTRYVVPIVISILAFQSFRFTRMWENDFKLSLKSVEFEGGADNLYIFATMANLFYPKKAYIHFRDFAKMYPHIFNDRLNYNISKAYYYSDHIPAEEKLQQYLSSTDMNINVVFFRAKFLEEHGREEEAQKYIKILQAAVQANADERHAKIFVNLACNDFPDECQRYNLKPTE